MKFFRYRVKIRVHTIDKEVFDVAYNKDVATNVLSEELKAEIDKWLTDHIKNIDTYDITLSRLEG